MKRLISHLGLATLFAAAVWLNAWPAWALTATAPVVAQNGAISMSGPANLTTCTTNGAVYGNGASAFACTGAGAADTALISGSPPAFGKIVNATIDAAAAIARSKIANGTADHVLINSGGGALSSEATLAGSRGGLGAAQPTCTGTQRLTCNGTACTCSTLPVAVVTFSTNMDIAASNTVYLGGGGIVDATESRASIPWPAATIANLRCRTIAAAGAGANHDVVVTGRVGACGAEGNATLTCTLTGGAAAASCSDTSNSATPTAGQCFNLRVDVQSSVSAPQVVHCTVERTA